MSSASYSNAKTVQDVGAFLTYLKKTFPTATGVTNADGVNVVASFSAALTAPQQTTLAALVAAYQDLSTGPVDAANLSLYNVSTAPLAANGVYAGGREDVSRYAGAVISVRSDVASAASGLSVQFGAVAPQADSSKAFSVVAGVPLTCAVSLAGRYVRVVYTNGAALQGSFSLQTKLSVAQLATVADASTAVDDTTQALLTRNLNMGRQDRGAFTAVRADEAAVLRVRSSGDTALAANSGSPPLVQADFLYSVNPAVATSAVASSGTVAYAAGAAVLSTAALASSSATLTTRRYVTCGVGRAVRALASVAFAAGAANSTQLAGVGGAENGLFWGFSGTSFGVLVRSNSVDVWVPRASFAVDRLDGTGPSGYSLNPSSGNCYGVVLDGTGFGTAVFGVLSTPASGTTDFVVAHRVAFGNSGTATGLRIPSGPLTAQVANGANASALSMRVAGLAAFADGPGPHVLGRQRSVDFAQSIGSTSPVPVLSVLNKTYYQGANHQSSLVLQSVSVSGDGTKGSVVLQLVDSPALTGAAYADVSAATSTAQLDTAATSLSGGAVVFSATVQSSGAAVLDLVPYDIRVGPGQWVTAAAKCTASGVSAPVSLTLNFKEDA